MRPVTASDADLIETTQGHLTVLGRLGDYSANGGLLRAISAALRALFVEELLARAWKASRIGGPVTVRTWAIKGQEGAGQLVAFCGGGEIMPGIPVSFGWNMALEQKALNLKDFSQQTRIQVNRAKVSTRELIKYVANKRGGSHLDSSAKGFRPETLELLRRIEAGEFDVMGLMINDARDLLHHEVLSVAQAVVGSPEVGQLMAWRPTA